MNEAGWENLLDAGETIVWQGRPDAAVVFKASHIFTLLFGMAFSGFSVFWMAAASRGGGGFWMLGLIHFTAGIFVGIGPIFGGPYKRRHTWYTLTNKRAFIATNLPMRGRKLKSYPIIASTAISYEDNTVPSLYFASRTRRSNNRNREIPIGFERIEDGPEVMKLIRKIQQGNA